MTQKNKKLRILISAGPTREYLDPVRYLSNDSSGLMGFSLAGAAASLGLKTILVSGPVTLPTPKKVRRIDVISAADMKREMLKLAPKSDIIIMAAAVADWRPLNFKQQKIKRKKTNLKIFPILFKQNPDILAEIGKRKKPHQTVVGFALETGNLKINALKKLKQKNCDWIVANSTSNIGSKSGKVILINKNGKKISLPRLPKTSLAVVILSHLLGH